MKPVVHISVGDADIALPFPIQEVAPDAMPITVNVPCRISFTISTRTLKWLGEQESTMQDVLTQAILSWLLGKSDDDLPLTG